MLRSKSDRIRFYQAYKDYEKACEVANHRIGIRNSTREKDLRAALEIVIDELGIDRSSNSGHLLS
jgi:hypothetical protein